jgi:purine-binding chemotaxis protein CheW
MIQAERKYLIFSMSGRLFAFDLSQVAEVSEPQRTWPVPVVPPCYRGAMNFHGSIVAVMDLAAFMGFPANHVQEKLIVLNTGTAALAFLVERVLRIVAGRQAELREAPEDAFATALIILPEGVATLLDAKSIATQATEQINR